MPKPIVRKGSTDSKSVIDKPHRSPLSMQLSQMVASQKEAFENLSPNAKKLHDSIKDADRYQALTDHDIGIIEQAKNSARVLSLKVQVAAKAFISVGPAYYRYGFV